MILNERELHEECGVFGVFNVHNASELTYYGLHALQHRGQEGAGMVVSDENRLLGIKNEGNVRFVFPETVLKKLSGQHSIGHVRYSTTGGGGLLNVQPFLFRHGSGDFALCHNGNIVNSRQLKTQLERSGTIFQSSSDSEILAHLIQKETRRDRLEAIKEALIYLEGAFAFLLLTKDTLYAMRDKHGLRPISIGQFNGGYVVASETCALDAVGATFVRDILPGEIVVINKDGIHSTSYSPDVQEKICAMEYIYFSRPDSDLSGINVHRARKACGRQLAKESHVDADIVIGVPDSSLSAASGYAEATGLAYELGLIKNKYSGRTFIEPSKELREKGVKMKLAPVRSVIANQRVILIDDSIVRGTTSMRIVSMLKEAGAKEVHVRIASPPIIAPCFYGVDTSTMDELISAQHSIESLRQLIGADSLAFLSMEGLTEALGHSKVCHACFTKKYPTHLYDDLEEANKDGKF
jgi:amidophosphoribosyltransferase